MTMLAVRLRRPPSMPLMFGALGVVALLLGGVYLAGRGDGTEPATAPTRADALEAYSSAIVTPTRQAGFAILQGIKPDIEDFRAGRISADVWMGDMVARARDFKVAWDGFAAVSRPREVAAAETAFDESFRTYLLATHVLREAGTVTGADREHFIEWGAAIGDQGDQEFNAGAEVIQTARRALGLGRDANLPDPKAQP